MAKEQAYKKISVRKVDLARQPVGFELEGKFLGFTHSEPFKVVDSKGDLVEKTLTNATFEDSTGDRFAVIADKGLQSAIKDAMVKEGTWIKAVKLEKSNMSKGRTMNQYDLYTR